MFKVTKVDSIPKKRRTNSSEIVKLFDDFIQSEAKIILVESDKTYSTKRGLASTLESAKRRYGYHTVSIVLRGEKTYLVKKDL